MTILHYKIYLCSTQTISILSEILKHIKAKKPKKNTILSRKEIFGGAIFFFFLNKATFL